MENREKELIDGYRKLSSESKNLILSTVITAVTAQDAALREYARNNPLYADRGGMPQGAVLEEAVHG